MGVLWDQIRSLVASGEYVVSLHAAERLDERGILSWQVAAGVYEATLISERERSRPNPSVEVKQALPDGTPVKVVWSLMTAVQTVRLVTVHFYD